MNSIILPSYNGSRFLAQSINSVLDQSIDDWELILVDDCSTDNTWEIMQEYQKRFPNKVQCLHHETNRKLPAALNTGFAASKGKYLTWTSDDNTYNPDAIEQMMRFLDENSKIDLVYCDYLKINEQGDIHKVKVLPPEKLMFKSIIGPCFMYRREIFDKIGEYSDKHFLAEDYEYFVRVAKSFSIQPLHISLYMYRMHESSLSSTKFAEASRISDTIILKHARKLPFRISSSTKAIAYQKLYRRCIKRKALFQSCQAYLELVKADLKNFPEIKRIIKLLLFRSN